MSLTQYLDTDDINRIPVSEANPLPVTGTLSSGTLATEATLEAIRVIEADIRTAVESTTPVGTYPYPVTPVSGLTAQMTGTTSTAVTGVGAAASKYNYITQVTVSNSDATVGTTVELQDGNGGTTFYIIPAAALYGGAVLSFPTPLKQPTINTALYAKCTTTSAEVYVSVTGFQAA